VTAQQIDKLWNEREAYRKLSEDLQKELEKVKGENENLRNVVAASNLKNFGN
jgi:hemerythrin-like domain-containing protein